MLPSSTFGIKCMLFPVTFSTTFFSCCCSALPLTVFFFFFLWACSFGWEGDKLLNSVYILSNSLLLILFSCFRSWLGQVPGKYVLFSFFPTFPINLLVALVFRKLCNKHKLICSCLNRAFNRFTVWCFWNHYKQNWLLQSPTNALFCYF